MIRTFRSLAVLAACTFGLTACVKPPTDPVSLPAEKSLTALTGASSFDFYLLTLSWSPEFCLTHHTAECDAHSGFVLHGLWPQRTAGGPFLENCSSAAGPADPSQYSDIFPDAGLLAHEWKTHGTCSGLSPDAYFTLARKAVQRVAIPQVFRTAGTPPSLTPKAMLDDFGAANSRPAEDFAVRCGNNHLTAIEACFTRDLQPMSCAPVKTCHANLVKITPPGGTR